MEALAVIHARALEKALEAAQRDHTRDLKAALLHQAIDRSGEAENEDLRAKLTVLRAEQATQAAELEGVRVELAVAGSAAVQTRVVELEAELQSTRREVLAQRASHQAEVERLAVEHRIEISKLTAMLEVEKQHCTALQEERERGMEQDLHQAGSAEEAERSKREVLELRLSLEEALSKKRLLEVNLEEETSDKKGLQRSFSSATKERGQFETRLADEQARRAEEDTARAQELAQVRNELETTRERAVEGEKSCRELEIALQESQKERKNLQWSFTTATKEKAQLQRELESREADGVKVLKREKASLEAELFQASNKISELENQLQKGSKALERSQSLIKKNATKLLNKTRASSSARALTPAEISFMAKEGQIATQKESKPLLHEVPAQSVEAHAALKAEILREKEALSMHREWDEIANKDVPSLPSSSSPPLEDGGVDGGAPLALRDQAVRL